MSKGFDVVVVGAGPGGIAAATIAAEAGCRVCLLDDNATPGGQLWRGFRRETAGKSAHGGSYLKWTQRLRKTNCEVWSGWQVVGQPAPGFLRLEHDGEGCDLGYERLILATGARERFLPFPGWTLPGVTGAGGLQALIKAGLDAHGKRVVVAGSGPLLLAVAAGVKKAGGSVAGIYEQAPLGSLAGFGVTLAGHPGKLVEGALYRWQTLRSPYRTGCWVVRAEGHDHVERVTLTDVHKQWTLDCDWLACGFHLVPNLELPRLLGCRVAGGYAEVSALRQSSVPGVFCVGELTGVGGLEKALLEGQIAGSAAAGRAAEARALAQGLPRYERFAQGLDRAFAPRQELRTLAEPQTLVCRCEDVAYGAVKDCSSRREAKLHTRCGMGACQGRVCGTVTEFLFDWESRGGRPPVFPTTVATLAAGAPERVSE